MASLGTELFGNVCPIFVESIQESMVYTSCWRGSYGCADHSIDRGIP